MKRTSPLPSPRPSLDQRGAANVVEALLDQLARNEPAIREVAAAELGDLFQADAIHGGLFAKVVTRLTDRALAEENFEARESMFSALVDAGMRGPIDCQSIASSLDRLDRACLEYALILLGRSGKLEFKERISQYLKYAADSIRQTAADALVELDAIAMRNGKK